MKPFTSLEALVVPVDRANIDTDAILAKQFMKSISRTGFGENLFDQWRYLDRGEPGMDNAARPKNKDFPLNQERFAGAEILLSRENFGCGSSREHAVWALSDYGFRAVVAASFADIFYGNCFKNGVLPIQLERPVIDRMFGYLSAGKDLRLNIDLEAQTIVGTQIGIISFDIDAERKRRLLLGLDDIALTLGKSEAIRSYESTRRQDEPWLF
jgi:3-isopropylmalate/(R)-2-methylmalate dehydratase small subunit